MVLSTASSFGAIVHQWRHTSKNFRYFVLLHSKKKHIIHFAPFPSIVSFSSNQDSTSPAPISTEFQLGYDPSEELFGLSADLDPSKALSSASTPRSWFGPNGQYIKELPCPSCRGRGYTQCSKCGIERSRLDCSECNGRGMVTCHQCSGECVIWEESIDERPWEKARSISPLKVKEDEEVDNLEIKLAVRKKSKRVYRSPSPEVGLKISRSLKLVDCRASMPELDYSLSECKSSIVTPSFVLKEWLQSRNPKELLMQEGMLLNP